ncbi:zinc-ribbon domain-containing protein [Microbacterium sp. NPDC091382]|uniref:zinc-ribbon domain-containing protein n=1 Tax=Microbacterium sp. NPDC091382 TaxID=3364210 RepID=UPI00380ED7F2
MLPDIAPLLVRVRPTQFEVPASFEGRLREANAYPARAWNTFINAVIRDHQLEEDGDRERLLEKLGALRKNHFQQARAAHHGDGTTCPKCWTGLGDRFACRLCARGQVIDEGAHDGPRVCARHRMWVGPGTVTGDQFVVGMDVVRADRKHRRLRRNGSADAHRLAEVSDCVRAALGPDAHGRDSDARVFVLSIRVLATLLHPREIPAYFDSVVPLEKRYETLRAGVARLSEETDAVVLTDALWMLLRSTALRPSDGPHDLSGIPLEESAEALGPWFSQLRSSTYPRSRHQQLLQLVGIDRGQTRYAQSLRSNDKADYVCLNGHRFMAAVSVVSAGGERGGCGYCANKRLLLGHNTLADVYPDLAAEWDYERNDGVTPRDVFPGSGRQRAWICAAGHRYSATPNTRTTKGSGCGICSNKVLSADVNSLAATHPDLVESEWDWGANGSLKPDQVLAGSERAVAWRCREYGHPFVTAPVNRTRGRGCHVCTRQKPHPSTCLAATHPDVAALWDYTRNGDLTPEVVMAGSNQAAWWVCSAAGHSYDAAISSVAKGIGCRFCSNRGVAGHNSMAATHPELAAQLHPTKNPGVTAHTFVAGTSKRLWWQCERLHEWMATGDNRVRSRTGCPFCSNKKVWPGWNDMQTTHPDLAAEMSRSKNGPKSPANVVAGTGHNIHWECGVCGHEWQSTGDARANRGRGCPICIATR